MVLKVFVTRAQPWHDGHMQQLLSNIGDNKLDTYLILIGSANEERTARNPFDVFERERMIIEALPINLYNRIKLSCIDDNIHSDNFWYYDLVSIIERHRKMNVPVFIIGDLSDNNTKWVKQLCKEIPDYIPVDNSNVVGFRATNIRDLFFNPESHSWDDKQVSESEPDWEKISTMVHPSTLKFLKEFYIDKHNEYLEIKSQIRSQKHNEYLEIKSQIINQRE